jgi:hypothetical protein
MLDFTLRIALNACIDRIEIPRIITSGSEITSLIDAG